MSTIVFLGYIQGPCSIQSMAVGIDYRWACQGK